MVNKHTRILLLAGLVAVGLIAGGLAALVITLAGSEEPDDTEAADEANSAVYGDDDALAEYYDQELQWEDCAGAECATVTVPVDYSDPEGETIELAVNRLSVSEDAERALFINPGGPGGSGIDYAPVVATQMSAELREEYDVIGFDPRGVGQSNPIQCLPDDEFADFLDEESVIETREDLDEAVEAMREFGQGCVDDAGDLASLMSTQDVAQDLDVLRVVFGQEKLDYYGASYGTHIGAAYADLYPERSGRLVLDAAVGLNIDPIEQNLVQAEGFQVAFDAFAEWCVAQDSCGLGDSVEQAGVTVSTFLQQVNDGVLEISAPRDFTPNDATYGIIAPLYQQELWPILNHALTRAISEGNGEPLQSVADLYFQRDGDTFSSNMFHAIFAVRCLDSTDTIPLDEQFDLVDEFTAVSPVFGEYMVWDTSCQEWPAESPYEPLDYRAEGTDPIMVIGTTRDPATPLEWSEQMAANFENGFLLTRDGDGHGGWGQGSDCTDDAVEQFLSTGEPPDDGLVCD